MRFESSISIHSRAVSVSALAPLPTRPLTLIASTKLTFLKDVMALIVPDNFQHILRILNTNVEGEQKIMYALTNIKGCGRRFANLACKKAEIDLRKRAGELVCSHGYLSSTCFGDRVTCTV